MAAQQKLLLCGLLALLTIVTLFFANYGFLLETFQQTQTHAAKLAREAPKTAALLAVIVIATWILTLLPSTPIELTVAFMYHPTQAFPIVYAGKVTGCLASFLGGRACYNQCETQLGRYSLLSSLRRVIHKEPYRFAFLMRAAYIPIAVKNYGSSALGTPIQPFTTALMVVEIYNSLEVVLIGTLARDAEVNSESSSMFFWRNAGLCFAILTLVLLGVYTGMQTRRELARLQGSDGEPEEAFETGVQLTE